MKRRELLKKSVIASLGLSLSPGLLLSLESCSEKRPVSDQPIYLSEIQFDTLWVVAELILPKTETPGANDARVAPFIDSLFGKYLEKDEKEGFELGLNAFIDTSEKEFGKKFIDLKEEIQFSYLENLDQESKPDDFFKFVKQIILWAYFTSEVGMKSMNYLPVPGRYNGCIEINQKEKNLVGNR